MGVSLETELQVGVHVFVCTHDINKKDVLCTEMGTNYCVNDVLMADVVW